MVQASGQPPLLKEGAIYIARIRSQRRVPHSAPDTQEGYQRAGRFFFCGLSKSATPRPTTQASSAIVSIVMFRYTALDMTYVCAVASNSFCNFSLRHPCLLSR